MHIDLKSWPEKAARCGMQSIVLIASHAAASLFALQVKENIAISAPDKQLSELSRFNMLG